MERKRSGTAQLKSDLPLIDQTGPQVETSILSLSEYKQFYQRVMSTRVTSKSSSQKNHVNYHVPSVWLRYMHWNPYSGLPASDDPNSMACSSTYCKDVSEHQTIEAFSKDLR